MCDNIPKRATDQTGQHGWQSALMTSKMWLSNVVGEYLTELDQKPEVTPSAMRIPEKGMMSSETRGARGSSPTPSTL